MSVVRKHTILMRVLAWTMVVLMLVMCMPETAMAVSAVFSMRSVSVVRPVEHSYKEGENLSYLVGADGTIIPFSSVAFDFHIFSNEASIGNHTNGNIA